ncbi:M20 family metallopeptidase [Candidatus Omnitrophota bacterium]
MEEVFISIDNNKQELIDLTQKLVSIPTVNPPGKDYDKIVNFLERYCRKIGLATRRIHVPSNELKKLGIDKESERVSLIAIWNTSAKKTLHINGHYDVVLATNNWSSDPFKPIIKRGRIYGRGSADMKGNIASTLIAIKALKDQKVKPKCNIELSFTPDEETGGAAGFKYLVRKKYIKPNYAIGEGYNNDYFSYGNKGIAWFRIEVRGKSCHSSEPHKGINSFEKMILVANEFMKLKKRVNKRRTRYTTKNKKDRYSTMVMGGELWGGEKANIVPDKSVFTIDRRILPEESIADAKREIYSVVDRLKKRDKTLDVKLKIISAEPSNISDSQGRLFDVFSRSIYRVLGKKAKSALLAGATDMRFLMRRGVPCLGYSPDGGHSCHCDNEYVKIKSLVDTTKILANVIAKI